MIGFALMLTSACSSGGETPFPTPTGGVETPTPIVGPSSPPHESNTPAGASETPSATVTPSVTATPSGTATPSITATPAAQCVDEDGDGATAGCSSATDCDDADPSNFPGNAEVCDSRDNDCNPKTSDPVLTFYPDLDGDEYPIQSGSMDACVAPENHIQKRSDGKWDCDDADAQRNPGLTEVCDGKDNDCNSGTAEPTQNYYADRDGDQFPLQAESVKDCTAPSDFIQKRSDGRWDCDDTNAQRNPDLPEICDGIDNDCNSGTAEPTQTFYPDLDGDQFPGQSGSMKDCNAPLDYIPKRADGRWDCDDTNAQRNPDLPEICDGIDNDCNSGTTEPTQTFYPDLDGDQFPGQSGSVKDCNASLDYIPKRSDGRWDCDDTNAQRNPDLPEICDGIDNDCNSSTSEATQTFYPDADSDDYPSSSGGKTACSPPTDYIPKRSDGQWDCNDSKSSVYPGATEVCSNGVDEDCDNHSDDGCCTLSDPCNDYTSSSARYICTGGLVMQICGTLNASNYLTVTARKIDGSTLGAGNYRLKVFAPSTSNSQSCDQINTDKGLKTLSSSQTSLTFDAFDTKAQSGETKAYCVCKEDGGDQCYWCSGEMTLTRTTAY